MIKCESCNGSCEDSSLYCTHCGKRLNTEACRKCGNCVPPEAQYCPRCGYPTKGTVCARCGKLSPDTAVFCADCGSRLKTASGEIRQAAPTASFVSSAENYSPAADKAAPSYAQARTGKGYYAYTVVRAFMLPLLLMCMFISSFFGTFRMTAQTPYVSGYGDSLSVTEYDMIFTGFDSVRGMFLLINPPTEQEVQSDFAEFAVSKKYGEDDMEKALRNFGVLRLAIYEGNITTDMAVRVVLWGIQSLALMVLSLVFFIITLVHAVNVTLKKREGFYKHESMPLSLITALTFVFLITGGALAGAAISTVILGLIGLAGITAVRYAVEKHARRSVLHIVRGGVVALVVVLAICFMGNNLLKIDYNKYDSSTGDSIYVAGDYIDASDVYEGFTDGTDKLEDLIWSLGAGSMDAEDVSGEFLDALAGGVGAYEYADTAFKNYAIKYMGSPAIMSFISEVSVEFNIGQMVLSWLMFACMLLAAAGSVMTLYSMLQAESNPDKRNKSGKWLSLILAGAAAVLMVTIWQVAMSAHISNSLEFGFGYHIGAMPIATVVLALAGVLVNAIMGGIEKKKGNAAVSNSI